MKIQGLLSRGRFVLGVCLASVLALAVADIGAEAQVKQGKYVTEASVRLVKLIDASNSGGFSLSDNTFSIGGGWLKKSNNYVPLFTINLQAGKKYRFLAAGDADAKDVDLEVVGPGGNVVASDGGTESDAIVDYTPAKSGAYLVRVRLYASDNNLPCVCLAIVMSK